MSGYRKRLETYFQKNHLERKLVVLLSGGVDSAVVACAAQEVRGRDACALTLRSEFFSGHDVDCAVTVTEKLGLEHHLVRIRLLDDPGIRAQEKDRCYRCKRIICATARDAAGEAEILDGTNADDDPDRPGRRALREFDVCSPLAECGLTKAQTRVIAREYGLPNADRPSNSCLATRLPWGKAIRCEDLARVARLEEVLRDQGFTDVRARLDDPLVIVEIPAGSERLLEQAHSTIMRTITGLGLTLVGYTHRKIGTKSE
ncbi:MAG: asparagine synthase-related protein [Desulfovibrio sp.]